MNDDFATAMGRALAQTRAGDPMQATRTLQAALHGGGPAAADPQAATATGSRRPRRPLGQVVDALARGNLARRARPAATPAVPLGASFDQHSHDTPHGTRDCHVFRPSPRDEPARGLLLMLHGCTQTADDFAIGTAMNRHAERENLIVVYADQAARANHMGCWNWFRPGDQVRGGGEPAILADMAGHHATRHGVPDSAVFAAGLSAGGAMAAILGAAYPDVFSAVAVHSGLAPGAASDMSSAFAAMQGRPATARPNGAAPMPSIVFHGTADTTVAPSNGAAVIAAALGAARTQQLADRSVPDADVTHYRDLDGRMLAEHWALPGGGHAWSGGAAEGSYTDPTGPDASAEILRFFLSISAAGRT